MLPACNKLKNNKLFFLNEPTKVENLTFEIICRQIEQQILNTNRT